MNKISEPTLSASILKDPNIKAIFSIAVEECYLDHGNLSEQELINLERKIGDSNVWLRHAGLDSSLLPPGHRDEHAALERAVHLTQIR